MHAAACRAGALTNPRARTAPRRLVVIGNGMAAARTLEELVAIAPDAYAITVFGAEPRPSYNRILLSSVLAGETGFERIVLNDATWHRARGIDLRTGVRVTEIDRARRIVIADDGSRTPYDRLLIATGSHPLVPPVPGTELRGVISYRDIADTESMIAAAGSARDAVVVGGGLLGLEAANGLASRGMRVTVVHLMDWIMERQLDAPAARLLQASLEARGIRFALGARTQEILGYGGTARAVRLAGSGELAADLVVFSTGIRPNVELARRAGISCDRGVQVSDTMQTYDPRVYAVGECVAHRGVSYGLVAPLYDMARVCARHLAGMGASAFRGAVPATRLKVTGIEVFSAGDFTPRAGDEELVYEDLPARVYRKLVVRGGRLAGAVMVGDVSDAAWYQDLISNGRTLGGLRAALMFGRAAAEAA